MLEGVIAVGFDLDGTLYQSTSEINDRVRSRITERILQKKPELKDLQTAREFFELKYKELESGTRVLGNVGYKNPRKVMDECFAEADITCLIPEDPTLVEILNRIRDDYFIYLITSSPREIGEKNLKKIGIKPDYFDETIFGDDGFSKDDGSAFVEILSCIDCEEPGEHLYVGDKANSDIIPARNLGMRTASVWYDIPEANYYLKSIHDIGGLLL